MIDLAFAVPGDLNKITGGYAYARQLFKLLPHFGVEPHHLQLPGSFPFPISDDLETTSQLIAQVHPNTALMVDGLAYGALPRAVVDAIEQRVIALVHHPLALESGRTMQQQEDLRRTETVALSKAERIITTSSVTARVLEQDYGVPNNRVSVAEPGTQRAARAHGGNGTLKLLAVGAVISRKNYLGLIDALRQQEFADWELTIVGATDHDIAYARQVREAILGSGLRRQILLAGEVSQDELNAYYAGTDIFVMPSRYEGYGMVLTEALARGLPIVCTNAGAMAETVSDDVALKVEPGNPSEFARALAILLENSEERRQRADAAWAAAQLLPSWDSCAQKVANVVKSMSGAT